MSQQKIFFLIGVVIFGALIAFGAIYLSKGNKEKQTIPPVLRIWIREGTTESYEGLKEGFKTFAPEYAKTEIVFEKKTPDPLRYRTLLLSTMTDDTGPDIFMLGAGEDSILETKIDPLPAGLVDISGFEKNYDDLFFDLVVSTGSKENPETFLKGVPLGFETLGVFYNKGLLREIPKNWNEIDTLYNQESDIYPTNIGLGPKYTPNATDILGFFALEDGAKGYENLTQGSTALERYTQYAAQRLGSSSETNGSPVEKTLRNQKGYMDEKKYTTYDLFLDGKIALILAYPSTVAELEKSAKRTGDTGETPLILTDRIPYKDASEKKNLARYNYFALSKFSKNSYAGAKFLAYLMTPDAQKRFLEKNTTLIAAQPSFWEAQKNLRLSPVFARTKLESFIPERDEKLTVFEYGLKSEFEGLLSDSLDTTENIDIGNIPNRISHGINCSLATYLGKEVPGDCEQK